MILGVSVLRLFVSPLLAEEPEISGETGIIGPVSEGNPTAPLPSPEPLNLKVKSTAFHQIDVEKASEFSDLPPVKGKITATVQLVEDPGLTDPLPPLPDMSVDDAAVQARLAELRTTQRSMRILFVSATVYDHKRTFLRCFPNGQANGEVSAWSNVDFNHFSGFSTFQVKGEDGVLRKYALIMGIGNVDTQNTRSQFDKNRVDHGVTHVPKLHESPELRDEGATFEVFEGNGGEAFQAIADMHSLYRKEGQRMKTTFHAREKANAERKASLITNPPVPKDVTIQFWKRENPSPAGVQALEGEVKP